MNYAFNIPACGATAVVYFSDVKKLVINSYLWHPTYGYFKIIAFDFQTGQVTILNQCQDGNAAAGTSVPACTCFIVTATPFDVTEVGATCVAIDFTAPAVGDCLDITVTNVNNIEVGGQVAIGSGIYVVDAVISPTIITICNEGQGITPGTPVIALDSQGNYQYCLSVLGVNPCSQDAVTPGIVVACSGGTMHPLDGVLAGSILTLSNSVTNEAEYRNPVTDFSPCDASASNSGALLVCIDGGATTLNATFNGAIPVVTDHTLNIVEFQSPACFNYENLGNRQYVTGINLNGFIGPGITPTDDLTSNSASITINNISLCRTMRVMVGAQYEVSGSIIPPGAAPNDGSFKFDLQVNENGAGFITVASIPVPFYYSTVNANVYGNSWNIPLNYTIVPGGSLTLASRMIGRHSAGTGQINANVAFFTRLVTLEIAV